VGTEKKREKVKKRLDKTNNYVYTIYQVVHVNPGKERSIKMNAHRNQSKVARYVAVTCDGRMLGKLGYMHRVYIRIMAVDKDGNPVYLPQGRGFSPYVEEYGYWASHYKTGMSKKDTDDFNHALDVAIKKAAKMTSEIKRAVK